MTSLALSVLSVTSYVNETSVPVSSSVTLGAEIEITGPGSSSAMVPVPSRIDPSPVSVARTGELSLSTMDSSTSSRVSPVTVISTFWLVVPGAKFRVVAVSAA